MTFKISIPAKTSVQNATEKRYLKVLYKITGLLSFRFQTGLKLLQEFTLILKKKKNFLQVNI